MSYPLKCQAEGCRLNAYMFGFCAGHRPEEPFLGEQEAARKRLDELRAQHRLIERKRDVARSKLEHLRATTPQLWNRTHGANEEVAMDTVEKYDQALVNASRVLSQAERVYSVEYSDQRTERFRV